VEVKSKWSYAHTPLYRGNVTCTKTVCISAGCKDLLMQACRPVTLQDIRVVQVAQNDRQTDRQQVVWAAILLASTNWVDSLWVGNFVLWKRCVSRRT
jgi:hypothetical protein